MVILYFVFKLETMTNYPQNILKTLIFEGTFPGLPFELIFEPLPIIYHKINFEPSLENTDGFIETFVFQVDIAIFP